MNENSGAMCRIPVKATMQYVNGVMTMVNAEWADISADAKNFYVQAISDLAERCNDLSVLDLIYKILANSTLADDEN